ncbi:helix-turn-helix domain-containing protein [Pseudonocardia sp. WMMC193]|uniref:helix-turn-helix domain-containing protein n=1 Tax=Pseudonocardia sp. WMMC193 TaxID=2911965 RepID=UPI001F2FD01D|nr:helix-turn-helix domain-containing protein [Pseudonocardia sp. WMMC193]MCF7551012.1 helix-turn-helix domain-containing protein [Pseudonocardia sp. WMMC193]
MTTAHVKAEDGTPAAQANDRIRLTVRALRSAYDVDVPVLARYVGVSRNTLYNRLNGMGPFSGGELVRIAEFFDTTVQAICDGSVTISPNNPPPMTTTELHTRR